VNRMRRFTSAGGFNRIVVRVYCAPAAQEE
jgi:hypothetical protein